MHTILKTMALLSTLLTVLPGISAAQDFDPETGYARIRALTSGLESMTAQFHQELLDADGQLIQEGRGTLSIQRPNRFRWQYSEPYEQLVLGDGDCGLMTQTWNRQWCAVTTTYWRRRRQCC